ncbi:large conductance mechanosensitive channel protein MscL [Alkalicoccus halolimnae]|uniref:Large-conductance mechanosensitive channel n=1 Tax=Alkalicoccus halolimnae TaxID=1667239 RepID=A0A5C7F813_9BACI|nr:large conductance mechanosensitive channel protein MscL [Alkalicoccus halolimnae]TXF86811.1 large conductance mechanosensitive channel protein MscL [Alkalicoccus halolimnae]
MIKELKAFAVKGNVVDLAIAVVFAAAFGQVISAFVNHIMTPLLGIIIGGVDIESAAVIIGEAEVRYGMFLQSLIDFGIITLSLFIFVKAYQALKRKETSEPDEQTVLLREIRNSLKK